jgi:hypothetical protein
VKVSSTVATVIVGCIAGGSALAQTQENEGALEEIQEVAITGTCISGFTAPTPVTSAGSW